MHKIFYNAIKTILVLQLYLLIITLLILFKVEKEEEETSWYLKICCTSAQRGTQLKQSALFCYYLSAEIKKVIIFPFVVEFLVHFAPNQKQFNVGVCFLA